MATCSATGIRDFPIQNRVTVTDSLNQSILEDFLLDIQWGKRSTAPQFTNAQGYLDDTGSSAQTTTLRLQGNSYNLVSVQMAAPQHASFLTADRSSAARAEMVLVFKTTADIAEKYLFLCVPIVAKFTTSRNTYLEALRTNRLSGKPIGLDLLLPQPPGFISYSTCIRQLGRLVSGAVQVRVLVFVAGLDYPEPFLQEIQARIPGSTAQTARPATTTPLTFPNLLLPEGLMPQNLTAPFAITSEIDYKALLRYGLYQGSGSKPDSRTRTDPTRAYQCVPLKPDRDVRNGQITIDTTTGKPLSSVLDDKEADTAEFAGPRSQFTPAQIEKAISISLGIFILFCFALFISYLVLIVTSKRPVGQMEFSTLRGWFSKWGPVGLGALLMGTVGFLLGIFVR